ncbi:hypothetical protein, conserved [Eimeria acervulina]|uniref:Uncharacterized protein n=1 Tax=Eimeria acervulina TaxID=5801 RepID=U6GI40_EIMAC|nr:hypothetical protein, conserved [Eimeria acervulina]CDI79926.1 hypothetical protein, conserved [Eimeria acervulina]
MLASVELSPGDARQSEHVQPRAASGAIAASAVNAAIFSDTPFPLSDMDPAASPSQSPLKTATPARPVMGVALMVALLVTIFLVLRCVYHLSTVSNAFKGTKGRRISDHGLPNNPCELPQQDQQRRQDPQQEVAGAAVAIPEASVGPHSVEGAAGLAPTPPPVQDYPLATHLDLIDVHDKSTSMEVWMLQVEATEAGVGKGCKFFDAKTPDLLLEGVKLVGGLQVVDFSEEVNEGERRQFMVTLGQCKDRVERLVGQSKCHWIDLCNAQASLLKSNADRVSVYLQKVHGPHPVSPEDPAVGAMMDLRKTINSATKVCEDAEVIFTAFPEVSNLGSALSSLSSGIHEAESLLMGAADACAKAWTEQLTLLRQMLQGEGDEPRQRLSDGIQTAKETLRLLRSISGTTPK